MKLIKLLQVALVLISYGLHASTDKDQLLKNSAWGKQFIENKGQIIDQNGKHNPAVKYLLNCKGLNVQIKSGGFSYDIYKIEKKAEGKADKILAYETELDNPINKFDLQKEVINYQFHRIDIELVGANPNSQIIAEGRSEDYTNYYNVVSAPEGIMEVHQYSKLTVKNIYNGIDVEYLLNENGFKYNFIVHAGANINDIKLRYVGAPFKVKEQELIFNTSIGTFTETIPASWLIKESRNKAIKVSYKLIDKETISFFTEYKQNKFDLVIDPSPIRVWGTYYIGTVHRSNIDQSGNVYLSGITIGPGNVSTSGSHQATHGGNYDAFLAKFNTNGVRLWGTYYGGSDGDVGWDVSVDANSNAYVTGFSSSDNNISTLGSHQPTRLGTNSSSNAFLVKFNSNGVRQWGTYYGSTSRTIGMGVCNDKQNNIYLIGFTNSETDISTIGSHQESFAGGLYYDDGFLVKFNSNGVRQWGTYYGGIGQDRVQSVITDSLSNVYLAGNTNSTNNISSNGSHQVSFGGGENDAFLAKFNTNGVRLWGTYYGGSNSDFQSDGIGEVCTDNQGNVYLVGGTASNNNIATPSCHQTSIGGSYDAFLVKFNTNGFRQWGTYYGGSNNDVGSTVGVDSSGNVYIAGNTSSTSNISTLGSHQISIGGLADAFLTKFDSNGFRKWGTYYGGNREDYGNSLCTDNSGNVYLSGKTSSSNNIATSGSHEELSGGAFLAKFNSCNSINIDSIQTLNNTFCTGKICVFSLDNTNAIGYLWTVPQGWNIVSGQNTKSVSVIPNSSGTISVKTYNVCGDTSSAISKNIMVTGAIGSTSLISSISNTLCKGKNYVFSLENPTSNAIGYYWKVPQDWSIISGQNSTTITVIPNSSGIISVKAYNACGDSSLTSTKNITVVPLPVAGTVNGQQNNLFINTSYLYFVSQQLNHTYQWFVTNGSILTGQGTNAVTVQWINSGSGMLKCVVTSSPGCNDTTSITLQIGSNQTPSIVSFMPTSARNGETVMIYGSNLSGASSVKFGGVNSQSYNVLNSNQISAVLGIVATGDVSVTTPNGNASLGGFTFIPNTGLYESTASSKFFVYPNPASNELNIDFSDYVNKNYQVLIINVLGQKVYHSSITEQKTTINLTALDVKGVYVVNIVDETGKVLDNKKVLIH